MEILLLIAPLALIVFWLRLPLFEVVFATLLLTPVVAFPVLGVAGGSRNILSYLIAAAMILGVARFIAGPWRRFDEYQKTCCHENFFVFLGFFGVLYSCTQIWPDFIALGERLRDYALLSSVLHNPRSAAEPWLAGYNTNYYLYWYRVGAMFAELTASQTWQVYHALQALTTALFGASLFGLARAALNLKRAWAILVAVVIVFGSNVAGILSLFGDAGNWWGPSRVIVGAINEFPAWSFLLGDLHPHFLNLCLLPFVLLLVVRSVQLLRVGGVLLGAVLCGLSLAWCYNANAWEVPLWAIVWSGLGIGAFIYFSSLRWELFRNSFAALGDKKVVVVYGIVIWLVVALLRAAESISPGDTPVHLVAGTIARSDLWAFLAHWGIPVAVIVGGLVARAVDWRERILVVLAIFAALTARDALPMLTVLAGLSFFYACRYRAETSTQFPWGLCFSCLGLIMVAIPEVVFLDDPYGGENERMNTIFKVYSAAWWLLHLGAVGMLKDVVEKLPRSVVWRRIAVVGALVLGAAMLGFFVRTVPVRAVKGVPLGIRAQGLGEINRVFPGAAEVILGLGKLPRSTVLEAQGPAYDYTTHVATLSGHESYLGWANHINLLTRKYDEVSRREKVTKEFYTGNDCAERARVLVQEKIRFVVVGPLERRNYPDVLGRDFGCLTVVVKAGEAGQGYVVYAGIGEQ